MAEDNKKKPEGESSQELSVPQTPREITKENVHLVDFDNLKLRLICLITIPNAFTMVENFLKRRGWEIFVTTELKDALTQVSTFKPDFVLMSVNHTHNKINQFPQIITQTFNIPVIAFGEKTDSKSMSAVQASRALYKILGHVSGPTAQRKIKQILQERHKEDIEVNERSRAFGPIAAQLKPKQESPVSEDNKGASVHFSTRRRQSQGAMIFEKDQSKMKSALSGTAYNPLNSAGGQDSGEEAQGAAYNPEQETKENKTSLQKEETQKPEISMASEMKRKKDEMAAALRELGSQIGSGNLDRDGEQEEESEEVSKTKKESDQGLDGVPKSYGSHKKQAPDYGDVEHIGRKENKPGVFTEEGIENKSKGSATQDSQAGEGHVISEASIEHTPQSNSPETSQASVSDSDVPYSRKKEKGYTMEAYDIPEKEDSAPKIESEAGDTKAEAKKKEEEDRRNARKRTNEGDNRSIIEKATIQIISKMKVEEHESSNELGVVSRVALLSVGHDNHRGYFMIAGHDFGMSLDELVEEFTEHFRKFCHKSGEHMEFGDYINMDCPHYDFFDNGEEGLVFNYVTSFGSGEVGVKFIHDEEAWAHTEIREEHEKTLIKAEQVVEDKPLEIDLFVHLQRNDKYFKIVSTESELSKERKDRLVEKKTEVFINNDDVGTYRSYQTKQKAMKAINKTVQRTTNKKAS